MNDENIPTQKADFLIVGLGDRNVHPTARSNAGHIFCDYLGTAFSFALTAFPIANCVSLQSYLCREIVALREAQAAEAAAAAGKGSKKGAAPVDENKVTDEERILRNVRNEDGTPKYGVPVYRRYHGVEHDCDIFSIEFVYTNEMVNDDRTGSSMLKTKGVTVPTVMSYRLILAKPQNGLRRVGPVVKDLCTLFDITDTRKSLMVAYQDNQLFPGAIQLNVTSDSRKGNVVQNRGVIDIEECLGTFDFVRLKLGIGMPPQHVKKEDWINYSFDESREMELFGYALDQSAQALQMYMTTMNLEKTRKKYCKTKLPSSLQQMAGLVFPVELVEANE
ncbi:MAG: hypothetical protein SGCHY_002889 [Lobulomycetales sp.]